MKVLLIGSGGQLGWELCRTCPPSINFVPLDYPEIDLSDGMHVDRLVSEIQPDWVINAAAYTAVDKAESELEKARAVNGAGVGSLASSVARIEGRLVQISTDFVFDGEHGGAYPPDAECSPLGVYGQTKREGELAALEALPGRVLLLRTAWLYSSHGTNFVKTMLRLMKEKDQLGVVDDQIGTPTWAHGLATTIWRGIDRNLTGCYHWTDAGVASWYDFAVAIRDEGIACGLLKNALPVSPIPSSAYPTPAQRPSNSVLSKTSTWKDFDIQPVHWREQLRSMLQEMCTHA
ncbi:MAG: dTDP-4-dehydrorhamnose reductase [Desulfoplanes sp.]|nr:dTDP-4-dehydrorhamnose reductase [Paludibacter sp.]MDD4649211.1 dTDP-4-dehydrorhamnose reductase [Desulfoplanes sp.]